MKVSLYYVEDYGGVLTKKEADESFIDSKRWLYLKKGARMTAYDFTGGSFEEIEWVGNGRTIGLDMDWVLKTSLKRKS